MSLLKNEIITATNSWQYKVVGAAGTTAAVISEESMKYLRYCVNWLQYALQHISQQMHMLRGFLVSLALKKRKQEQEEEEEEDDSHNVVASIKQDMALTLRKVVDIISGCTALPGNAKTTVRNVILNLPQRWSALNNNSNSNDDNTSNKDQEDALRLLAFGQESSDMLQSIHSIFQDTIQRAENWLEKLKLRKSADDEELIHNFNQLQLSTST